MASKMIHFRKETLQWSKRYRLLMIFSTKG